MNTALLIVDVQNDYFPGGKMPLVASIEASERIKEVMASFRKKGKPIIHIQHIAASETATFFLPNSTGAEFHENVTPQAGELVLQKHYPNSFRDTGLDQYCKQNNITSLVIAGMMTHMCIDTTTRAAFDLGYNSILLEDCCATRDLSFRDETLDARSVQIAYFAALNGRFAQVMSSQQYGEQEA